MSHSFHSPLGRAIAAWRSGQKPAPTDIDAIREAGHDLLALRQFHLLRPADDLRHALAA